MITSRPPRASTVSVTSRRHWMSSAVSHTSGTAPAPASTAASSTSPDRLAASATDLPDRPRATARQRPIPDDAPTTSTRWRGLLHHGWVAPPRAERTRCPAGSRWCCRRDRRTRSARWFPGRRVRRGPRLLELGDGTVQIGDGEADMGAGRLDGSGPAGASTRWSWALPAPNQ